MSLDKTRFHGVFTALVTPFKDDEIDWTAFDALIESQIHAGVAGLVPVGTTGEAATLSDDEAEAVIRRTVERTAGRAFVLAGAGGNDTKKTVAKAKAAEALGADGILVVTPYYNKPSQAGLIAHYSAVAEATSLPIMLYSVPGRCGIEIAPATCAELAKTHANIIGIKEAGGDVLRVTSILQATGPDFIIHSGDDGLTLPMLSLGAVGLTSVVSNYAPAELVAMVAHFQAGRLKEASILNDLLSELYTGFFIESNPAPVKAALAYRGAIKPGLRLPLTKLTEPSQIKLEAILKRFETKRASCQLSCKSEGNLSIVV